MPGTTWAVQNATCSVSAKKLSELRFRIVCAGGLRHLLVRLGFNGKAANITSRVFGAALAQTTHVHDALGKALRVEVGDLLAQTGLQRALVVGNDPASGWSTGVER